VDDDGLHLALEGKVSHIQLGVNASSARDFRPSLLATIYGMAEWQWIVPSILIFLGGLVGVDLRSQKSRPEQKPATTRRPEPPRHYQGL
jgi:hypothetical protein